VSLLSGTRNQRNSSLSEQIYNQIQKNFPNYKEELIPAAILLANTYQSSDNAEKATVIKNMLNHSRAKKQQGLSWTEVNGKIFVS
jgi:cell division protein YceG involved in septum cleavage